MHSVGHSHTGLFNVSNKSGIQRAQYSLTCFGAYGLGFRFRAYSISQRYWASWEVLDVDVLLDSRQKPTLGLAPN